MPARFRKVGEAHSTQWQFFVVVVALRVIWPLVDLVVALLVSLVVVAALSSDLTSAQGPVNNNSANAASFNIIEPPYDHCVAFSKTL